LLLIALLGNDAPPSGSGLSKVVVAMVGLALSIVWYWMQRRSLRQLGRHEQLMATVERALGIDPAYAVSADVNVEGYRRYVGGGPRARQVMPACCAVGALAWTAVILWTLMGA
jgi:hypothetical protein